MGDGNCFFRSLAEILYSNEKLHTTIRAELVAFVAANWPKYKEQAQNQHLIYGYCNITKQEYIDWMATDGRYADNFEVYIAAEMLDKNIIVYANHARIPIRLEHGKQFIYLHLESQHYSPMREKASLAKGSLQMPSQEDIPSTPTRRTLEKPQTFPNGDDRTGTPDNPKQMGKPSLQAAASDYHGNREMKPEASRMSTSSEQI